MRHGELSFYLVIAIFCGLALAAIAVTLVMS